MQYQLKDGTTIAGDGFTTIGKVQHPLWRMSDRELSVIGVKRALPPQSVQAPTFDPTFYTWPGSGDPVPRAIEDIRAALKNKVANDRWLTEQAGVTVGGVFFATDQKTRSVLTAAFAFAKADPGFSIPTFRVPEHVIDGVPVAADYISLTNGEVQAVALAVAAHVQSLYDTNKAIDAQIDALQTVQEAEAFSWSF